MKVFQKFNVTNAREKNESLWSQIRDELTSKGYTLLRSGEDMPQFPGIIIVGAEEKPGQRPNIHGDFYKLAEQCGLSTSPGEWYLEE